MVPQAAGVATAVFGAVVGDQRVEDDLQRAVLLDHEVNAQGGSVVETSLSETDKTS